jgi:tRNA-2-methylthio-N6-dimethylallyladenosine synthase
MTSHPKDLSDGLILAMRECGKICSHLHLPFQSGSTKILGLMNRRYTKDDYLALVGRVRGQIPDISLTTDIIVGFPGEDEADFADTLDVVEKARFALAYTFIYSKRAHTPAAALAPTATGAEIKARFDRLVARVNAISAETNCGLVGKRLEVFVESADRETGVATGRSSGIAIAHISAAANPDALIGTLQPVLITGSKTFYLNGEIANE